jgi:hypothetical protein
VNGNRQKQLFNPSASPFMKAESQTKHAHDTHAVTMKGLMTNIERRFSNNIYCGDAIHLILEVMRVRAG